jgi:hypothetical protein
MVFLSSFLINMCIFLDYVYIISVFWSYLLLCIYSIMVVELSILLAKFSMALNGFIYGKIVWICLIFVSKSIFSYSFYVSVDF